MADVEPVRPEKAHGTPARVDFLFDRRPDIQGPERTRHISVIIVIFC